MVTAPMAVLVAQQSAICRLAFPNPSLTTNSPGRMRERARRSVVLVRLASPTCFFLPLSDVASLFFLHRESHNWAQVIVYNFL